jgi:tetratricopeptide (TPR) repeat protein
VAKKVPDLDDLDLDLPAVPVGLPDAKRQAPKTRPAVASLELDLPTPVADLPAVRRAAEEEVGLPVIAAHLPVPAAALPSVAANLPSPAANLPVPAPSLPIPVANLPVPAGGLPVPAASLPVHAGALPVAAQVLPSPAPILPVPAQVLPVPAQVLPVPARGFGEIDFPGAAESPSVPPLEQHTPPRQSNPAGAAFGEIELPHERVGSSAPPIAVAATAKDSADFGDLKLEDRPRSGRPGNSGVTHADAIGGGGGMTFGEVDFGASDGGQGGAGAPIALEASSRPSGEGFQPGPIVLAAASAPVSTPVRPSLSGARLERLPAARSYGKLVAGGLLIAAILGGASLQLTPLGAFGYLAIGDAMHASDYVRATSSAMGAAEKSLAVDTYDAAKGAAEAAAAAHARTPRARSLTAYAAMLDAATSARFGADTTRASRAKQLLAELPPNEPVKYADVAAAALAAADGDLDRARKALEAASKREPNDPIQLDVALMRGGVELAAKDAPAALVAYKRALALSGDARAHFGLARAYDMMGDAANTRKEIEATLAASPQHVGALTLRARTKSAPVDETQALADLARVLDGPARAKASPGELSRAFAERAWVCLERGSASEARDAFAQAVKLDPRNTEALEGEGRLLLNEGRYTEALARFDTALQYDPSSPETVASDAEAKIALERLADAKQQLLEAKQRFPKSQVVLLLLGKVEQRLGNNDAAEADLRAAVANVDPAKRDAVLPYVALSELLSARGHLTDATGVLDEARKKLPASGALDRAFGEVAELQGDYDTAIADYRSAIAKDAKDVATHFRLAVALRRIRRFDEAAAELDRVASVDKDYPGLSLERGLLFEESGDVQKAIDQFQGALAKAPDDPDLQLRVGSAYVVIGRPDDALPMLRKVLEKRPTSAEAYHYIGRALMLKGRAGQADALRHLRRAVELDPNRAEFHVYLAWAANDAQPAQLELARDEIDKALVLDNLSAEAYWQRGVLERMEGAIEDAIKDEKHALALRPSRYEAHATLAECYDNKNDEAGAAAEWVKAIAGDSNAANPDGTVPHPYWHYRYGKLLMDHGNTAGAVAQLLPAVIGGEKAEQRFGWLAPAEFLTAEALRKSGRKADAIEHYRRFLEIAPVNSPDRVDAQAALTALGANR